MAVLQGGTRALPRWRERSRCGPRLPSKACKLTAALAAKAYSASGQAASALHAMAILQFHQAKALKQMLTLNRTADALSRQLTFPREW